MLVEGDSDGDILSEIDGLILVDGLVLDEIDSEIEEDKLGLILVLGDTDGLID